MVQALPGKAPGEIAAFLELHIEQGPVLEQLGIPVGIVTAIAAPTTLRVTVHGEGGHAGALLMALEKRAQRAGGTCLFHAPCHLRRHLHLGHRFSMMGCLPWLG